MLTPQEQKELAQLEQEEQMAQSLLKGPAPAQAMPGGLTQEEQNELAMLEQEENLAKQIMAQNPPQQMAGVDYGDEADLGFMTRAKYSIEPLESNRRALLIEKFGAENVQEDPNGDIFVRQGDKFRPVNKEGLSFTDVTDFAGATPEMIGAGAGALLGAGAGSVPAAIGGGMIGSAARQGISAMLGTPQVAPISERGGEVALSGAFSGAGAGAGKLIKSGVKKIFPKFKVDKSLKNISKELDIPEPTPGQLAGGRDLELEKQLAESPIFGRKIRKTVDKQIEGIKRNLSKQFGDIDPDFDRGAMGGTIKERANTLNKAIKSKAGELFDELAEKGKDVAVPSMEFKNSLAKQFGDLGLVDANGELLEHTAKTGLTETQFNRLQGIAKKVLGQIDRTGAPLSKEMAGESAETALQKGAQNFTDPAKNMINASDINVIRKFVDANIKEGAQAGVDDVALMKLREGLMNVTEDMLGAQNKSLKRNFRAARALWKKHLDNKKILESGKGLNLNNLSDEKSLDRIFRDAKSVKMLREVSDPETVKQAGDEYMRSILSSKVGGEDSIGARSAISAIRRKREAIKEAIGKDGYDRVMKNLEFLDRIGKPINPSKTGILRLRELTPGNLASAGLQAAERLGRTKVRNLVEDLPQNTAKRLNLFTDTTQRGIGFNSFAGPKIPYRGPQGEENNRR